MSTAEEIEKLLAFMAERKAQLEKEDKEYAERLRREEEERQGLNRRDEESQQRRQQEADNLAAQIDKLKEDERASGQRKEPAAKRTRKPSQKADEAEQSRPKRVRVSAPIVPSSDEESEDEASTRKKARSDAGEQTDAPTCERSVVCRIETDSSTWQPGARKSSSIAPGQWKKEERPFHATRVGLKSKNVESMASCRGA